MLLHEDIKAKRTAAMFTCAGLVLDPRQFGKTFLYLRQATENQTGGIRAFSN